MNFQNDLVNIIKNEFDREDVCYDANEDACVLATRYLEMLNRRIVPIPREVYLSDEIHDSLGALSREADVKRITDPADAWNAVFLIRYLLTKGKNVNGFLSKRINFATGKKRMDGALWNLGMHHFHLSTKVEESNFVKRSSFLLFAIITRENAYFVDVRSHGEPLLWVRRDLLEIVNSNWPELIEMKRLRGVSGTSLTDEQRQELRRKNIIHAEALGDKYITPIGGGTTMDGSSLLCRWFAMKLLHELDQHQRYFDSQLEEVRSGLDANGIRVSGEMDFELVLLHNRDHSDELIDVLTERQCLSKDLCQFGFAIVEKNTQTPIAVSLRKQA